MKTERPLLACVALTVIYVAFSVLLPLHRFNFDRLSEMTQTILIVVPTAVFMMLQLLLIRSLVSLKLPPVRLVAGGVIGLVSWFALLWFIHPIRTFGPHLVVAVFLLKNALLGVGLTISLSFFGCLISLIVKEKNLLLPVALIAMPVDFIGAMTSQGFTHDMVKHAPKFVSSVSVSVPAITSQTSHGVSLGPIAFIGPGDVLFMALFFAAVMRFELAEVKTFWWMYALLTASMLLVLRLPNFMVGALVPMGLAVIVANVGLIKLNKEELYAVAYAGLLVLGLAGFFFWSSHRYLFHAH
jgi:hypothetical protein